MLNVQGKILPINYSQMITYVHLAVLRRKLRRSQKYLHIWYNSKHQKQYVKKTSSSFNLHYLARQGSLIRLLNLLFDNLRLLNLLFDNLFNIYF